jgi:hypothetical protein
MEINGIQEANMKLFGKIAGGFLRKAALATAVVGGLAFFGAGTGSAHPRVVVSVGIGAPLVAPVYVAPAPYYGPVVVAPRLRYWDARFHCWRYR